MPDMKNPLPNFNFTNFKKLEEENIHTQTIDVDSIKLNPNNDIYNKYDTDEDITELAETIKLTKFYVPLIVKKVGRSSYEILSGEKRYRALTEKLGYDRVDCKVLIDPTPEQEEAVFDGTNLTQRTLTNEQKFNGYLRLQNVFENSPDKSKYLELLKISSYKRTQYENIIKNVSPETIQQYQDNEISFNDLVEAAEAQKRLNKEQRRLNDAVKIYSESNRNSNTRFYVDSTNHLIFSVEQRNYKNNVMYAVKEKDYTLDVPGTWTRTRELPECDTQEEMQILLDKYAVVYALKEITAEEYISLLEKTNESKSARNNESEQHEDTTEKIPGKETLEDIQQESEEETLKKLGIAMDSFDDEGEDYSQPYSVSDSQEDILPNSSKAGEDEIEYEDEDREDAQLDLIANNYALNLLYKGREIETNNVIRRGRLFVNLQENRYFLVQGDVQIQKQIPQSNGVNAYELFCCAYEVEPSSVTLED